jgi:hypothetical protein
MIRDGHIVMTPELVADRLCPVEGTIPICAAEKWWHEGWHGMAMGAGCD